MDRGIAAISKKVVIPSLSGHPFGQGKQEKGEKEVNFKEALTVVQDGIRNDPELYYGYQSNIAMAFVDAIANWRKKSKLNAGYINKKVIHEAANEAAKNFLNLWM